LYETPYIAQQVDVFLVSAGALVRINDAGRDHGQIRVFENRTFDPGRAVPTVVLRNNRRELTVSFIDVQRGSR
jgi:hypothetical protein